MSQRRILNRGEHGHIMPGPQLEAWSTYSPACTGCGATERKHKARGLCRLCYARQPHVKAALQNYRQEQYRTNSEVRERILRASKLRYIYGSTKGGK